MKISQWTATIALLSTACAFKGGHHIAQRQLPGDGDPPSMIYVPEYNATLPIDHFNTTDTRTFNNRFFVNDTHYKPGGPVIFFDWGESGLNSQDVAMFLAEWNGVVSSPMELAKALGGVVIAWEHRYYGTSQPFPLNNTSDNEPGYAGIPLGGADEYRYLTVEQALADVAYFATEVLNKTELGPNNAVLADTNSTRLLDPYHTPWVWVGTSYPGSRGAWARVRNPEVFYAVWASSAPVEIRVGGSAYFNSIYRALPNNCTADIQAVVRHIDEVFDSGDERVILDIKMAMYMAISGDASNGESLESHAGAVSDRDYVSDIFFPLMVMVQSYGVSRTIQKFCDRMETFDVDTYFENASVTSTDPVEKFSANLYNDGDGTPSDSGIVASNSVEVGLAAFLYGRSQFNDLLWGLLEDDNILTSELVFSDLHSWDWQVLAEVNLLQVVNASSPMQLGSRRLNYTSVRERLITDYFPGFDRSVFPDTPNTTYVNSLGGWDMAPSNVMWTNGEFDPWRAFSVMSLDQDLGAPKRAITQDIPKCGEAPPGTDVFGLLFAGAVHGEDLYYVDHLVRGYQGVTKPPVKQGAELFIKAYNEWLPCFNASRREENGAGRSDTSVQSRQYH